MTVHENIRKIRKEKNLTQKQLGDLCNPKIAEANIRKYELGKANPKVETLERIAAALGVPPLQLLGFEDNLHIPDINSAMYDFSNKETQQVIEMLTDFKKLNNKGKQKAAEYTNDLTHIEEYTKPDTTDESNSEEVD